MELPEKYPNNILISYQYGALIKCKGQRKVDFHTVWFQALPEGEITRLTIKFFVKFA
jgi:hypothetical protein